jgi:hypothetical protein
VSDERLSEEAALAAASPEAPARFASGFGGGLLASAAATAGAIRAGDGTALSPEQLLALQRSAGNAAVAPLVGPGLDTDVSPGLATQTVAPPLEQVDGDAALAAGLADAAARRTRSPATVDGAAAAGPVDGAAAPGPVDGAAAPATVESAAAPAGASPSPAAGPIGPGGYESLTVTTDTPEGERGPAAAPPPATPPAGDPAEVAEEASAASRPQGQPTVAAGSEPDVTSPVAAAVNQASEASVARTPSLQREAAAEGGLLSGFGWLTDGWSSIRQQAADAANGVRDMAAHGVAALRSTAAAVSGQVRTAWDGLSGAAGAVIEAAEARGAGLLTGLGAGVRSVGAAIVSLDAEQLRSAWGALKSSAGAAAGVIGGVASAALGQLQARWDQVRGVADGLLEGLRGRASGLLESLPGAARAVQDRVSGAWSALVGRAGGILERVPGGSTIAGLWERARGGIEAVAGSALSSARSAWSSVQAEAGSVWGGIQASWAGVRSWAGEKAEGLASGFGQIAGAIRGAAVDGIIGTLSRLRGFYDAIRQAIADPGSVVAPLAQDIEARLQDLPERSRSEAQTRIGEVAQSGGPDEPEPGGESHGPAAAAAPPAGQRATGGAVMGRMLMRQAVTAPAARHRGTPIELLSSVWDHLGAKLAALWANLGDELVRMLLSLVWPPATWQGLKDDWNHMTAELGKRADRFESIRTDGAGHFFEDLQRFVSNLLDFPLIIWRTANAMLGRLSVYITLLLMLVGGVAGMVGGAVGGAILGALGGGAPAAPGAAAGSGIGFGAGALVGLGAATTLGTGLLISFVAAEVASIGKAIADRLFVAQTDAEAEEDDSGIADSAIALGIAGLLYALTWVGTRIARSVVALVRRIRARRAARPTESRPTPADDETVPAHVDGPATARVRAAFGDQAVTLLERAFGSLAEFEALVARVRATVRPTLEMVESLREHLVRNFGEHPENTVMLDRLKRIAQGELQPEPVDINFLQHELLERGLMDRGVQTGYEPLPGTKRVWTPAHDVTVESLGTTDVYHPDAIRAGGGGP